MSSNTESTSVDDQDPTTESESVESETVESHKSSAASEKSSEEPGMYCQ